MARAASDQRYLVVRVRDAGGGVEKWFADMAAVGLGRLLASVGRSALRAAFISAVSWKRSSGAEARALVTIASRRRSRPQRLLGSWKAPRGRSPHTASYSRTPTA